MKGAVHIDPTGERMRLTFEENPGEATIARIIFMDVADGEQLARDILVEVNKMRRAAMRPSKRDILAADLTMIVEAVLAGERCPKTWPEGPLKSNSITALCASGDIRSEVYAHNYRVVTILKGEHAGKSTKACPTLNALPYLINGVRAELYRRRASTR